MPNPLCAGTKSFRGDPFTFQTKAFSPRWLRRLDFGGKYITGASTPLLAHVVAKVPFRSGCSDEERRDSTTLSRINAFSARAFLDKSLGSIADGTPMRGVLDDTDSDYGPAQLSGCLLPLILPILFTYSWNFC